MATNNTRGLLTDIAESYLLSIQDLSGTTEFKYLELGMKDTLKDATRFSNAHNAYAVVI